MEDLILPNTQTDQLKEVKEKLTEAEKEQFFKAFLADKPYVAEETLFNGKLTAKFKTLNMAESNLVMLQMQLDKENGTAKDNDAYLIKVIQYRIAASLIELDKKPFNAGINETSNPTDLKTGTTYLIEKLKIMDNWPTFKISGITAAFQSFEKKVRALTEESFKENF